MSRRLGRAGRALLVAVVSVGLLPWATPAASAAGIPYATLTCGQGWVQTTAPYVLAQQGARGSDGPDAVWFPELFGHNGQSWVRMETGRPWVSSVATSDFNLGSTVGYAGPSWYPYGVVNGTRTTAVYWSVAPGYHYAIRNAVHDGSWSMQFASTGSQLSCRA